jgi:hypothetical protein
MGFDIIPDITTNPWQVVLAKKIFKDTADNKLKSMSGAQGWNTDLMETLVRLASDKLLPGANRWVYMNSNAGVNDKICKSFFNHIKDADVIDTPSFIGDVLASVRNFLKGTSGLPKAVADNMTIILVLAGVGMAAYAWFNVSKFLPKKSSASAF